MTDLFNKIIPKFEQNKKKKTNNTFEVLVTSEYTQVKKSIATAQFGKDCVESGKYVPVYYAIRDNDEVGNVIRKLKDAGLKVHEVTADGKQRVSKETFQKLIEEGYVFVTHVDYNRVVSVNLNMLTATIEGLPTKTRVDILDDCQQYIIRKYYGALSQEEEEELKKKLSTRDTLLNMIHKHSELAIYVTTTVSGFLGRDCGFDEVIELKKPRFHSGWEDIDYVVSSLTNKTWCLTPQVHEPLEDNSSFGLFDDSAWVKVFKEDIERLYYHSAARVGKDTRDTWVAAHNTALQLKKRNLDVGILVCAGTTYDPIQRCLSEENNINSKFNYIWVDEENQLQIEYQIADNFNEAQLKVQKKHSNRLITFDFNTMTKMAKSMVDSHGLNPMHTFYCTKLGKHSLESIQRVGRLNGVYPNTNTARTLIATEVDINEFKSHLVDNARCVSFFKNNRGLKDAAWRRETQALLLSSSGFAPNEHHPSFNKVSADYVNRFQDLDHAKAELEVTPTLITHRIVFQTYDFDDLAYLTTTRARITNSFVRKYLLKEEYFSSQKEMSIFKKALDLTDVNHSGESIRFLTPYIYDRFLRKNRAQFGEDKKNEGTSQAWTRMNFYIDEESGYLNCIVIDPQIDYNFLKDHMETHLAHDIDGSILLFIGNKQSVRLEQKNTKVA